MNKKTYLEAPSAELIVVRFEENFCGTTVLDSPANGFTDHDLGDLDE